MTSPGAQRRQERWGKTRVEEWERTHYHQPSDELRDDSDLSGAVEDIRLLFHAGLRIAGDRKLPTWTPGDELAPARMKAIEAAR